MGGVSWVDFNVTKYVLVRVVRVERGARKKASR